MQAAYLGPAARAPGALSSKPLANARGATRTHADMVSRDLSSPNSGE